MKNRPVLRLLFTASLTLFTLINIAHAQVQTAKYVATAPQSKAYYEYLPQGYSATGNQVYPLLIFIHGLGELGDGSAAQLPFVLRNGPPHQISQGIFPASFTVNSKTFRFIVLSPQFTGWPTALDVNNVIDYAIQNYKVDVNRIYLTGLSMGGGVVWEYAGNSLNYAKRIAAIVPVAGASWPETGRGQTIAAGDIAVWATHNDADPTVPLSYTTGYVDNINNAPVKPNPLAKKTVFSSASHDAWSKTYDFSYKENGMNVYEWMLQFQLVSGGVLPVSKLEFNAAKTTSGTVQLQWKTFAENNNRGFELERSINGSDFQPVSFVSSKSIGGNGATYSFIDLSPIEGKNYYRLKQLDINNNSTYSQVQSVELTRANAVKIYPNPVADMVNIYTNHPFTHAQIRIHNANGQLVKQDYLNGNGMISLNIKGLPAGVYAASIKSSSAVVKLRFIKQ